MSRIQWKKLTEDFINNPSRKTETNLFQPLYEMLLKTCMYKYVNDKDEASMYVSDVIEKLLMTYKNYDFTKYGINVIALTFLRNHYLNCVNAKTNKITQRFAVNYSNNEDNNFAEGDLETFKSSYIDLECIDDVNEIELEYQEKFNALTNKVVKYIDSMDYISSEIFKQIFFNNKKINEVSEILNISVSKIKQILFKMRKRMRLDLPEYKEILSYSF